MPEIDEKEQVDPTRSEPAIGFGILGKAFSFLRSNWRNQERRAPIFFTGSSIAQSIAQMLAGLVVFRFVAASDMGLWASVFLFQTYAFFLLAGIQNGLSRELPFYLGAQKPEVAHRLAATTLLYTLGGGVLAVAAGAGFCIYSVWTHGDARVIAAVAAVTLLTLFKFYQNYLFLTFRSKNSFLELSKIQMLQAASSVVTLPLLLWRFDGMLLRLVVVGGLAAYWMHRVRPIRVSPSWRTDSFVLLLRTGLPIFATDYIFNCAGTLDKVALLKFAGLNDVGLYTLAGSVFAAFNVLPQSVAHYVYPRMSHHYGRTQDPRVLWDMAWKTALVVTGSMLPIAIVGSYLLPVVVPYVFPKYVAGTHAAQIALFTGVAYGASMGANALASLKAWSHLFAYQLSYAGLLAIGPFIGVRLFASPLNGVAYGMLAANVLGALLSLVITFVAAHRRPERTPSLSVKYVPEC